MAAVRTGAGDAPLAAIVLFAAWALGCVSDLTVRAPEVSGPAGQGALAELSALDVEIPPARGAPAELKVVGERAAGLGLAAGEITLTENPGQIVRRVVTSTLEASGQRVVDTDPQVVVELELDEFRVEAPRHGSGWEVVASLRLRLRVHRPREPGEHTELVYSAERTAVTYVRPSLATTERVLGECLGDLATLLVERPSLARALELHSAPRAGAGVAPAPRSAGAPGTPRPRRPG